jgi:hypothetical protein
MKIKKTGGINQGAATEASRRLGAPNCRATWERARAKFVCSKNVTLHKTISQQADKSHHATAECTGTHTIAPSPLECDRDHTPTNLAKHPTMQNRGGSSPSPFNQPKNQAWLSAR